MDHDDLIRLRLANHQEQNRQNCRKKLVYNNTPKTAPIKTESDDSNLNQSFELFEPGNGSLLNESIRPGQPCTSQPSLLDDSIIGVSDNEIEDDQYYTDTITLKLNNHEHWLCMGYQLEMTKPNFTNLRKQLPLNFQWMLRQCAHTIQCSERDVYQELQVLENQYAYVLKSFDCTTTTNRAELAPGMNKLSNTLRNYW